MAGATVTVRELKNKDTGVDLTVTSYKTTKGMVGTNYKYQVVVVTILQVFKSAKHKETDTVQFAVYRKFADFEDLFTKLNTKFSGTALPPLSKRVLMMSDAVAKERRTNLDFFVKYLASTPKMCTSSMVLEFLGLSALKAGKMKDLKVTERSAEGQTADDEQTDKKEEEEAEVDLFDDDVKGQEDEDDVDLFEGTGDKDVKTSDSLRLFEDQDLGGAIKEDEGDDLFIIEANTESPRQVPAESADNTDEDLFRIDDDLDQIMKLDLKPKPESKPEEHQESKLSARDIAPNSTDTSVLAAEKPKPLLKEKPQLREKPQLKQKPQIKEKPQLKKKPKLAKKPVGSQASGEGSITTKGDNSDELAKKGDNPVETITEDDIMKYIQDNTSNDDDLDLFS